MTFPAAELRRDHSSVCQFLLLQQKCHQSRQNKFENEKKNSLDLYMKGHKVFNVRVCLYGGGSETPWTSDKGRRG